MLTNRCRKSSGLQLRRSNHFFNHKLVGLFDQLLANAALILRVASLCPNLHVKFKPLTSRLSATLSFHIPRKLALIIRKHSIRPTVDHGIVQPCWKQKDKRSLFESFPIFRIEIERKNVSKYILVYPCQSISISSLICYTLFPYES